MIFALLCSSVFLLASIEAPPIIPKATGKSFGELIDEFEDVEDDRRALLNGALETPELAENYVAMSYLVHLAEAHVILVRLRRYFEAALEVFFAINAKQVPEDGEMTFSNSDQDDFLKKQLSTLSRTYAKMRDVEIWELPMTSRTELLPVSYAFIHSEEKLLELVLRFKAELNSAARKTYATSPKKPLINIYDLM